MGNDISRMARTMAFVDCCDVTVTDHPYRADMPKSKAPSVFHDKVTRGKLDGMLVGALESLVTHRRRP